MSQQLIILLHSSKTMRIAKGTRPLRQPTLIHKTKDLAAYLKTLSSKEIEKAMHVSPKLASTTHELIQGWTDEPARQSPAIDSFIGDIYSGLNAGELSQRDRDYADDVLWILSGLYGFLRPYDGIYPYRLEMGYKFPNSKFKNLYAFWGDSIATQLPSDSTIVNVSAKEYTDVITPFVDENRIVTPQFLTVQSSEPTFVVVHAKIARGAFARWLITSRVTDPKRFKEFKELGYHYDENLSTSDRPVFICETFGGIGLSIRLADR
ncbi:MAG TPA: YaaA family protein [Candidatus Saccharimonadales bacterium]|nr:YaaA family protein [Candidatus Saccharimonadales bacterium]